MFAWEGEEKSPVATETSSAIWLWLGAALPGRTGAGIQVIPHFLCGCWQWALQPGHKVLGRLGAWENGSSGEPDCTSDAPYPGRAAARLDGAQPGFTDSPGLSQIHLGVSRQGVNPGKSSTSNRPVLEKPVNNSTFPVSLQKWEIQLLKVLHYG